MFENLINNIKNGFMVANATRRLVFGDKQLFIYPILAAIITIIAAIIIIAVGVIAFVGTNYQSLANNAAGSSSSISGPAAVALAVIFIALLYFAAFFITSYLTMAMLIAFREYTKGSRIGIGEALNRTSPYGKLILEWSIFYTIIATLIHIVESAIRGALSRYGIGGNIISGILTGGINLALAAAVAFALPVILDEKKGPIDTIKSSIGFIMKNFGDTFGGLVFAEIFQIVLTLVGLGLIFLGIIAVAAGAGAAAVALAIILIALGILAIIAGNLIRFVLFNCFKLIIYDYKTRKVLPKGFDAKMIDASIKRRGKPKSGKPASLNPFGIGMGQGNI